MRKSYVFVAQSFLFVEGSGGAADDDFFHVIAGWQ
jgi:hypothetical protein